MPDKRGDDWALAAIGLYGRGYINMFKECCLIVYMAVSAPIVALTSRQQPWIVLLLELLENPIMRLLTALRSAPLLAACVVAKANYPAIPVDTTTPVQQRLAIYGPNCKMTPLISRWPFVNPC